MVRAYSDDLRERVAAAVLTGRPVREVAATFGVSAAGAVKWSQRLRANGTAGSRLMGGCKQRVFAGEQQWLLLRLEQCPHLTVRVLAHAGSSYYHSDTQRLSSVASLERNAAVSSTEALRRAGFSCPVVSAGSTPTPTLTFSDGLSGVTEGRAGVYMFPDLMMAGIGVCAVEDIALSVMATVIGHHREDGWPITDAGWNALSADRGTARQAIDQGLGVVCNEAGEIDPDLIIVSANQEHGMIGMRASGTIDRRRFPSGSRVRILPVHACATASLHDSYHVVGADGRVTAQWARGRDWYSIITANYRSRS